MDNFLKGIVIFYMPFNSTRPTLSGGVESACLPVTLTQGADHGKLRFGLYFLHKGAMKL